MFDDGYPNSQYDPYGEEWSDPDIAIKINRFNEVVESLEPKNLNLASVLEISSQLSTLSSILFDKTFGRTTKSEKLKIIDIFFGASNTIQDSIPENATLGLKQTLVTISDRISNRANELMNHVDNSEEE